MNNCKEFVLDDMMAITAIPVADVTIGAAAWQLQPTIPAAAFSPSLASAVTIGQQPATAGGMLIPIIRKTGKAKDSESDSVAGRQHAVSVSCDVDDRDSAVWNLLQILERTPSHLLLTFRGGVQAFVQATQDTYQCLVERDGSKTGVQFSIGNLMGIQLIVS